MDICKKGVDKFVTRLKHEKKYIQMWYNRRCSDAKEYKTIHGKNGKRGNTQESGRSTSVKEINVKIHSEGKKSHEIIIDKHKE